MLANFGQHDVGDAGVATGRGGFSLPTLELPTISQHRLLCPVSGAKCSSHKSKQLVIKSITTLLRLMPVASDQALSIFLEFVVFPISPHLCSSAYAAEQSSCAFLVVLARFYIFLHKNIQLGNDIFCLNAIMVYGIVIGGEGPYV